MIIGMMLVMVGLSVTANACCLLTDPPFDPENPDDPNSSRQLINLTIGTGETVVDKTRIVINEAMTLDYDISSDASKFLSPDADYQIYSYDANMTQYSINERPKDDGKIPLGIIVRTAGEITIATTRLDCDAFLWDKQTSNWHDLTTGGYTFQSNTGTFNNRFVVVLREAGTLVGDANGDGKVNVTDIMSVANYILKLESPNFQEQAADVNADGRINVTDIMGIANIILKKQ